MSGPRGIVFFAAGELPKPLFSIAWIITQKIDSAISIDIYEHWRFVVLNGFERFFLSSDHPDSAGFHTRMLLYLENLF